MTVEELAAGVLSNMEGVGCSFWACRGPDAPFEEMVTCTVCATIQLCREALGQPAPARRVDKSEILGQCSNPKCLCHLINEETP